MEAKALSRDFALVWPFAGRLLKDRCRPDGVNKADEHVRYTIWRALSENLDTTRKRRKQVPQEATHSMPCLMGSIASLIEAVKCRGRQVEMASESGQADQLGVLPYFTVPRKSPVAASTKTE